MSTRISSAAALLLLLAACGQDAAQAPAVDPDNLIECALDGAAEFARECAVEHTRRDEGVIVIVRHPDGGFRRFVAIEGQGIAAADGAEPSTLTWRENDVEVVVGSDRYRFPTVQANVTR